MMMRQLNGAAECAIPALRTGLDGAFLSPLGFVYIPVWNETIVLSSVWVAGRSLFPYGKLMCLQQSSVPSEDFLADFLWYIL